jgi:hypothetical protein
MPVAKPAAKPAAKSQASSVDIAGIHRPAGQLDVATALAPYRGPWNERLAAHLLRRAGFGGTPDEVRHYTNMSSDFAVESLIRFPNTSNLPGPDNVFDPISAVRDMFRQGGMGAMSDDAKRERGKALRMQERQSILSMQTWWLNRMLTTPAPLQEKMALYLHGHFTSAAIQKGATPAMIYNQNQLFRQNGLGNLRELTRNVSKDPAMLIYLDGARNVAAHPNENYARELMELFTLGVDHYSEEDVRQSARAWTGWTVAPRTGQAYFNDRVHDGGTKTFLGQTGNWNGDDIVNIIFGQPQAAKFFAANLLNFFVYNDPEPELVDAVAVLIRKNNYELAPVMSTLFRSNVFFSDRTYRALVKSPVEFVVGTYKALGLSQIDDTALRALAGMGQILYYPPNVAGWPGGQNWTTSQMMIARQNFVAGLVTTQTMAQSSWLGSVPMQAQDASKALIATILQGDASPVSYGQLSSYLNGTNVSALGMLSGENRDERVRGAAYLTMAMPAYQLS